MENNNTSENKQSTPNSFKQKVWITVGIVAFTTLMVLFVIKTVNALLLILAGTLISIYFTGVSSFICDKTRWKQWICKTISILGTILIISLLFWLIGTKVQAQIAELSETLPQTIDNAKQWLNNRELGREAMEKATSDNTMQKVQTFVGGFFKSTFGVFGDLYVILFISIFFSIAPKSYIKGLLVLLPPKSQKKGEHIVDKIGAQLQNWIKGKLFSMFIVFALTAIGLSVLGLKLWLVLAILAGILSFIPNFGPMLALVPAVLVGLMDSPQTALIVVGLYVTVQFLESNFITPYIQKKLIKMPPALILIAQLFMGALTGGWGLLLATPITVIVIILVQELHLKDRDTKDEITD